MCQSCGTPITCSATDFYCVWYVYVHHHATSDITNYLMLNLMLGRIILIVSVFRGLHSHFDDPLVRRQPQGVDMPTSGRFRKAVVPVLYKFFELSPGVVDRRLHRMIPDLIYTLTHFGAMCDAIVCAAVSFLLDRSCVCGQLSVL